MSYQLADLMRLMACLRDPDHGCPWDRSQDYQSIVPFTLEEAHEVIDVIERGALDELQGELGDLLFQVVFYSHLAEEEGRFNLDDVIQSIVSKLLQRHPHVFPDATFESFGQSAGASLEVIKETWEAKKVRDRANRGQLDLFDDIPAGLPALSRAQKIQKRALRIGFDWPSVDGVFDKIEEELSELKEKDINNKKLNDLKAAKDLLVQVDENINFKELIYKPTTIMGYSANPGVIGSVLGLVLTGCLFAVQGFVSTGIEYDASGWFNF